MKLLIVDKSYRLSPEAKLFLGREGHKIQLADNLLQALDHAKNDPFDLALVHVWSEGFHGMDTYHQLKELSPQGQIVFVNKPAEEALMKRSGQDGALAAVLYKPWSEQELLRLLSTALPSPVLIATDMPHSATQKLLETTLSRAGKAGIVRTLVESIEILKNKSLNVLLVEMEISEMKMLEDLERIKKVVPDLQILTIYNETMSNRLENALQMGIPALVQEPIDLVEFLTQVGKIKGSTTKEKILVVDDDPVSLRSLTRTLREQGYQVFPFEKGIDSLSLVRSQFMHVALVDFQLQLSDFTGLEVVQKINATSPDTGTILMTEYGSFSMLQKALEENVYDCLVKPINPPVLKGAVEKALEKQKLVLENKRLLEDLKDANVELRRLNDLKSKFLSMVSHDLRSPLTAIAGYSEFLAQGQYGPLNDQQKRMLKIILQEGDYLNCLIGDLMDMASIEAGTFRLNKKPLMFLGLVKEVLPRIEIFTSRKGINLKIEGASHDITIVGDPQRLKQVLTNLLTNAVKHTPKGGTIRIRSISTVQHLEFQVIDNGVGIPPEVLDKIFEKFYQVESSPAKSEGLGLGLAIAKEIVQAHGGEITALSAGPGTGATFSVKLPFVKVDEK